ncbi:MAG: thiol-disulfide isomerase/thioredoxin [Ulvibacter sp.]|jgi:thiol-disulfide isomerase/thioredoxin
MFDGAAAMQSFMSFLCSELDVISTHTKKSPMIKYLSFLLISILMISCGKEVNSLKEGSWRATLDLGEGKELPFLMSYTFANGLKIYNAEEEIEVTDITIEGDSIIIAMPVFEGVFKGVFSETQITGDFIKPSLNRTVPFEMKYEDTPRFSSSEKPSVQMTGNWEVVFSPEAPDDLYIAKGVFEQEGSKLTGTFRTETGDYRYLEGVVINDSFKLSTFDGAHAFLFEGQIKDSLLSGTFYSGNHWKEPFTAKRNETYELPEANTLTFLKEGYERFDFSFPDTNGDLVSLKDERFQGKVVLVQIMGTWCPNCLDETKFYAKYVKENKNPDLEIVALAFEYAPTKEKAISSINRLIKGTGVPYPILLAQYGSSSKVKANEKLPMLNHVLSYPTTIFIDKKGEVRRIHTGFNGPATGEVYEEFVVEFESYIEKLTAE